MSGKRKARTFREESNSSIGIQSWLKISLKCSFTGSSRWSSNWESAFQCSGHRLDPGQVTKIPHVLWRLSLSSSTRQPWEPQLVSLRCVKPMCSRGCTWQLEKTVHLHREPTCHHEGLAQPKKSSFTEANKLMYVPSLNWFFVTCSRKNFSYINIILVIPLKRLGMHVHILVTMLLLLLLSRFSCVRLCATP